MSWWEDQVAGLSEMTKSPLIIGCILSAVTAVIRSLRNNPHAPLFANLCEAASCSMLSLMLTQAGMLWLSLPAESAMMIGVFVGWLGTAEITRYLKRLIDKFFPKGEAANSESDKDK